MSGQRSGAASGSPPQLAAATSVDRLVVCHGDACCPNTLLDDDGRFSAHVDLGEWNYGPGWERALLDGYGIDADAERMSFYRDLWNAT
ncbi:hypothetical protein Mlaev_02840 [Microbacterium laevaniformans]|uniref:Aminoglycoside phosphotransferase domain-containing protein n=1 Tax=Microbacterium laevaniformans TaxID=36807 RepID=A0A150H7K1_9MICO|nr:hypothetical protein Mlaev_02840 [Microbacterium laevaniformans]